MARLDGPGTGRRDAVSLSCVIGVFVLATIVIIMNLVGISSEPQLLIKGVVITAAVFLSSPGGVERISNAFGVAYWNGKSAGSRAITTRLFHFSKGKQMRQDWTFRGAVSRDRRPCLSTWLIAG
jgi:hypothetical protein